MDAPVQDSRSVALLGASLVAGLLLWSGFELLALLFFAAAAWSLQLRSLSAASDRGEMEEVLRKNLELRAREQALLENLGQVEAKVLASEQQLSSISHELRTPLTSIRAFSEILAQYAEDESAELRGDFLGVIMTEAERLGRLVDDLLEIARLDSEQVEWETEEVELGQLIAQTLLCVTGLTQEKEVLFELETPEQPLRVEAVPDRLHQAMLNLIANAWRFSPSGGRVRIALTSSGRECSLCVEDEGPGVPEGQRERIFERFVTSAGREDQAQGTGLGLAITRSIVERHGGTISCGEASIGGAAFAICLPLRQPERVAQA